MALIRFLLLAIFLVFVLFPTFSQEESPDLGYPEITNFTPKDWQGPPQCWSIMEDDRGVMYFGMSGIIEYDGVNWIPVRNSEKNLKISRSLAKDANGRIYVGGVGDLGYLQRDTYGQTEFISLKDRIPKAHSIFKDVFQVLPIDSSIYFQTYHELFRYASDMDSMEVWTFDKPIGTCAFDGKVYIIEESGLHILEGDSVIIAPAGEFLRDKPLMNILPFEGDTALVTLQSDGLYLYDGTSFKAFAPQLQPMLSKFPLVRSVSLPGKKFAIITMGGGVFIVSRKGELIHHLDNSTGLAKEFGLCGFMDSKGFLWVAMSGCISRIEVESPFSYYDERHSLENWVLSTAYYQGMLYVGMEGALMYFDPEDRRFRFVEGLEKSNNYVLCEANGVILAGNGEGIFSLYRGEAVPIIRTTMYINTFFSCKQSSLDTNLVICGTQNGLTSLKWKPDSGWDKGEVLQGLDKLAYKIVEQEGNIWWACSAWEGGVHRISFPDWPSLENPEILHFGEEQGIDANAQVTSFNGVVFGSHQGSLVHYDMDSGGFVPDSTFEIELGGMFSMTDGTCWAGRKAYNGRLVKIIPDGHDNFLYKDVPLITKEGEFISSIYTEPNEVITWIGTNERLIRYDTRKQKSMTSDRVPIIRKVSDKLDSLLTIGKDQLSIPYTQNRMRIEYAYPYYEQEERNQYSTWMEGMDETWSDWSDETYKEFMNLPGGDYTFRVKAKNIYGEESGEAVYHFRILPPWWQSWWAFCIYGVIGIILLYFVDRIQRKRLLKKEWEKAREKELAYSREIQKAYDELKATQAQLIQSEKMASLGELTAGIAHEIQNPLNFVNNFSEVNKDLAAEIRREVDLGNWKEVKALSRDIEANEEKITHHGKRADAIVKSMLQHSRSNAGKPEPTDINALTDEYLRLAYHGMRAKDKTFNAEMITDFDASIGKIHVVSQDIGRVILNLITNAFHSVSNDTGFGTGNALEKSDISAKKPRITVSTRNHTNHVEIRVKDNGNGISPEIREKIFQPFFTTKPTGKGTGLGLSLSYDIVKAHGGNIIVESDEGNGAEFIIQLPL